MKIYFVIIGLSLAVVGVVFKITNFTNDGVVIQEIFQLTAITVGFITLLMAPYYFVKRIMYEDRKEKLQRKRKVVKRILDNYDKYDELVKDILCFNFKDERRLKLLRERLKNFNSIIIQLIETDEIFLKFPDNDLEKITAVFSFVDKNKMVMESKFTEMNEVALYSSSEYYNFIFLQGRLVLSIKEYDMDELV